MVSNLIKWDKYLLFIVKGQSMYPTLHNNDLVLGIEYDGGSVESGDIIVFRDAENQVIHRVIEVYLDHVVCRGDHAYRRDAVSYSNIIAVATELIRGSDRIPLKNGRWREVNEEEK